MTVEHTSTSLSATSSAVTETSVTFEFDDEELFQQRVAIASSNDNINQCISTRDRKLNMDFDGDKDRMRQKGTTIRKIKWHRWEELQKNLTPNESIAYEYNPSRSVIHCKCCVKDIRDDNVVNKSHSEAKKHRTNFLKFMANKANKSKMTENVSKHKSLSPFIESEVHVLRMD